MNESLRTPITRRRFAFVHSISAVGCVLFSEERIFEEPSSLTDFSQIFHSIPTVCWSGVRSCLSWWHRTGYVLVSEQAISGGFQGQPVMAKLEPVYLLWVQCMLHGFLALHGDLWAYTLVYCVLRHHHQGIHRVFSGKEHALFTHMENYERNFLRADSWAGGKVGFQTP